MDFRIPTRIPPRAKPGLMATEMATQRVLVVLKIPEGSAKKDLEDITITVKTKSGDEITVLSLSEPNARPNDMSTGRGMGVYVCVSIDIL